LLLSVTTVFACADKDMSEGEGTCTRAADQDSALVGSVNVMAIACRSPADRAGMKRADVVVSINGITINGLTQDAYEDLLDMASSGGASWVILRKSFGRWEKKELTLLPAELGDDFSCGKPDSET
jgi:C-terminal processing protease CtpA/Prc